MYIYIYIAQNGEGERIEHQIELMCPLCAPLCVYIYAAIRGADIYLCAAAAAFVRFWLWVFMRAMILEKFIPVSAPNGQPKLYCTSTLPRHICDMIYIYILQKFVGCPKPNI